MNRTIFAFLISILIFDGWNAMAFKEPHQHGLPNFDKRDEQKPAVRTRAKSESVAALQQRIPAVKVDFDRVTGAPRLVSATDGFLTGPNGTGRAISKPAAAAVGDPNLPTKTFLNEYRALFGHGAEALAGARVKRDFVTPHNGMRTVVWEQRVDDISVFAALLVSHTTKNGELVNVASHFLPDPVAAADAGVANRAVLQAAPPVSVQQAIAIAAKNVSEEIAENEITAIDEAQGAEKRQKFNAPGLNGETEAYLVWLPTSDKTMQLCWEVILTSRGRGEMFRILVNAQTGEVVLRHCLTNYLTDATYRVYLSDSPSPFSPGHSVPLTNQPPLTSRVLLTTNAMSTNASPNGWIDDGGNQTMGNNVDAHLDRDNNNLPDLPRPQGSPARVFDFAMDLTQEPTTYSNAAVVQLFYWNNFMHDKLYELGFTEAAGNFQLNNFGRGGEDGDPVQADAQDGGGFNNANFATPPDGSSGRMQMYLFNGPTPDRDGDFDAEVVIHEYGHGLSNRRVGHGVGISQLQSAGMGEGWSDFYGITMLSEAGDDPGGNHAAGGYLTYEMSAGYRENYYYGIRRYPYSTNMLKNPLTFKDIDPTQASLHTGIPRNPIFGSGTPSAAEVHNQGEVWCVALWEARAKLIHKHGFAVGNQLILQLVTDGMNLGPANPNFLEARDAIIMADIVNNGGANYLELWAAFAKRGMGFFATSPPSSTTSGVVESYEMPDDFIIIPSAGFAARGPEGGPFTITSTSYTLTNMGSSTLNWTATAEGNWLTISQTNGTLNPGESGTITISLNTVASNLVAGIYTNVVRLTNHTSGIGQKRVFNLYIGQPDFYTEYFDGADFDLSYQTFTFTPDESVNFYTVCRAPASAFPTDPTGGTTVPLGDENSSIVAVSGNTVGIYGARSNIFYIASNGYITMGSVDTNYYPTVAEHFELRRIAPLWIDLDPSAGGTVTRRQLSDRVAVTFSNVPEWTLNNTNTFQVELFFNGTIRFTYLQIDAEYALVGLSEGKGMPVAFLESDFSSYGCTFPLKLSVPASATEGDGVLSGQGKVTITSPAVADTSVDLFSSDTSEITVPLNVIIPAGTTSAVFDITVVEDVLLDGAQTSIIKASSPDLSTPTKLVSIFDNETATLSVSLPATVGEGAGTIQGTVTMNAPAGDDIFVTLTSSDTTEIQSGSVIIPAGELSASFTLNLVEDKLIDDAQNVSITAHVENWTDGAASTTVLDNENHLLTVIVPGTVIEGNSVMPAAGVVKLSGTLPGNLTVSLLSSDTTELTVPSSVTITAGQTSAVFNITVVDDLLFDGVQPVTVTASALNFTNGAGNISVLDDETPPMPSDPFPAHLSENNPVTVNLSWDLDANEGAEQLLNGNFEIGSLTNWTRVPSVYGDFVINGGNTIPYSGDPATTPYAGSFSAMGHEFGPGIFSMYQDVTIPSNCSRATLSWADRIRNFYGVYATNQQFSVEIRNTNNVVLEKVFSTKPGDPAISNWTERTVDLTSYRGQRVRVTFVVNPGLYFLDVHLDNISLRAANPPLTTYDVYFGTNPVPSAAELIGTTTNTTWDLPVLEATTYYWQIIAHRSGTTAGPVWQFSTAPTFVVNDISVAEGDNALFTVNLLGGVPATTTVQYSLASGTAGTNDYNPGSGGILTFLPGQTSKVVSVPIIGDSMVEPDETFFLNLTNAVNAIIGDGQGVCTIINDDPLLAAISDKTIVEGTALTFFATNNLSSTNSVQTFATFESFGNGATLAMFRNPRYSPTTSLFLNTTPDSAAVASTFPAGNSSTRVLKASWSFNATANPWLRLTTFNTTSHPNPTIDFTQAFKFDIYTDKDVKVALGVRETSTISAIGADGGTSGAIEYVGVPSKNGSTPIPSRTIAAGSWQTVTFNLPAEPVSSFTGNGILESTSGKGALEHLTFAPAGGTGTYNVYLDNFSVVGANAVIYSLGTNAPTGASINPYTGIFTWTPTEVQGPGVYNITINATDNGSPAITGSRTFQVTVLETNSTPAVSAISNRTVSEQTALTFSVTASDSDIPANQLTFSLDAGGPNNATINATNGTFSWTPSEAQGPSTNSITVRVTDNGAPNLSATRTFSVVVTETNVAPVLSPVANQTVFVQSPLSFSAVATDADIPANGLNFSLDPEAPDGATINASSGLFNWTPALSYASTTNTITIRVTDTGIPVLSDTKTFSVIVFARPIFQSISVSEGTVTLSWAAEAGRTYRIQQKSEGDSEWNDMPGDVQATGSTASKSEPLSPTLTRFYRVMIVP